ncbi:unnamed protein product [Musa acuminata subsp. burmannicoides]
MGKPPVPSSKMGNWNQIATKNPRCQVSADLIASGIMISCTPYIQKRKIQALADLWTSSSKPHNRSKEANFAEESQQEHERIWRNRAVKNTRNGSRTQKETKPSYLLCKLQLGLEGITL